MGRISEMCKDASSQERGHLACIPLVCTFRRCAPRNGAVAYEYQLTSRRVNTHPARSSASHLLSISNARIVCFDPLAQPDLNYGLAGDSDEGSLLIKLGNHQAR